MAPVRSVAKSRRTWIVAPAEHTAPKSANIAPTAGPSVFNTNDDAKLALTNGQIDALVVDLPTAFYITSAELDNGTIVGQLPLAPNGAAAYVLSLAGVPNNRLRPWRTRLTSLQPTPVPRPGAGRAGARASAGRRRASMYHPDRTA